MQTLFGLGSARLGKIFAAGVMCTLGFAHTAAYGNPCSGGGPGVCFDTFIQVNIWTGTVQLSSAGGQVLSTQNFMTVETNALPSAQNEPAFQVFYLPLEGQSDAQYLEGNTAVPTFVRNNISSFLDSIGLGTGWDGTTFPTPAEQALYGLLTTQPEPFVITADTGDVVFGTAFEFLNAWGPFGPTSAPPPGGSGTGNDFIDGATNVSIFTRTIDEREIPIPAPEPASLLLLGSALIGFGVIRNRRRSW
jgi:hypothetical protein